MRDGLLLECLTRTKWALHEPVLRNLHAVITRHARGERLSAVQIVEIEAARDAERSERVVDDSDVPYEISGGGIGVVEVNGVLARRAGQVNRASQPRGTSAEELRRTMEAAIDDSFVSGLLLSFDSPGGSTQGIAELADFIYEAREIKPIWAQVDETMASAAYWIGAQCEKVCVPMTGEVGGIGVYGVVEDDSKHFAEDLKTTVHLIRAGRHKGVGERGVPIDDDHLAALQAEVDAVYDVMVAQIARGRGTGENEARAVSDGRVHIGADAVDAGLADEVQDFEATLSQMESEYGRQSDSALRLAGT